MALLRGHLSVDPATFAHDVEQLKSAALIEIGRLCREPSVRLRRDVLESFGDWLIGLATHWSPALKRLKTRLPQL
jgi:hypothetical protein